MYRTNKILRRVAIVGALGAAMIMTTGCNDKSGGAGAIQKPAATATTAAAADAAVTNSEPTAAGDAAVQPLASPLASPLESPVANAMKVGVAGVDRVVLRVEPGAPRTVMAKVSGYLGDACTQLGAVTQVRDGSTVRVNVGTLRPADRMCAQVVKDFEIEVAIDATGLPVGAYSVDVNGAIAAFDVDEKGAVVK